MKKLLLVIIAFLIFGQVSNARPQYSILNTYGTKCQNCHIQPNVGGQRSSAGMLAKSSVSLIDPKSIGLGDLFDFLGEQNSAMDGKIQWGLDFRYQNARWGQTTKLVQKDSVYDDEGKPFGYSVPTIERKSMIMQLSPYLQITPVEWLTVEGMYNFSYDIEPNMRYKAQQPYSASLTMKPFEDMPSLRIGYFQPSYSIDYDDHTYLVRTVASSGRSSQLFPADYAELGAQLNYDNISWLHASLGVFGTDNLLTMNSSSLALYDSNASFSSVVNVSFHPEIGYGFTTFFGLSNMFTGALKTDDGIYYGAGYNTLTSFFFNIGMAEKWALMTEYVTSTRQSMRNVNNFLIELNYQLMEPINVFGRFEGAYTETLKVNPESTGDLYVTDKEYKSHQYVLGTHIFPLPYFDFLIEYRIYDRDEVPGTSSQWAFQLHLFY